jgi:hypothetical protein
MQRQFWLDPVRLERSRSFSRAEIVRIEREIEENKDLLIEGME